MSAMLQQVSPQVAVRNFEKIAKASSAMISTNLPAGEVDRFMALALKAKDQQVSTLSLVPPIINPADPDIKLIRAKVSDAVDRAEGHSSPAEQTKKKPKRDPVVTGGSIGSRDVGYAANETEDLGSAC